MTTTHTHQLAAEHGSTLVELLTSTLFVTILMAMSYSFARAALVSTRVQEVRSEAQEVAVMAVDAVTRELHTAGFSAAGSPVIAIRDAGVDHLEVASDLDGDGDTDDANELIAYSYDDADHALMRATAGGSPQPMARDVPPHGVRFSYFDAAGSEVIPGTAGMALNDRRRIRRIDITVHVELANPEPTAREPLSATACGSAYLRNHE